MRRLLVNCAMAAVALAGFAAVKVYGATPTGKAQATAATAEANAAPVKPILIARGVQSRAVAVQSDTAGASTRSLYLTAATTPNRIFTLVVSADGSPGTAAPILPSFGANATAQLVPFAGSGQTGSLGDAGTALLAQFNLQTDSLAMRSGVAVAPDGTVFVADTLNSTIRRISGPNSSAPGIIASIAGKWAAAPESTAGTTLDQPLGVALDRLGNLYIADYATGAIYLLPDAGSETPGALQLLAHVASPTAIAVTGDGRRVFVASAESGFVTAVDTATHGILPSIPGAAAGLAVDGAGNLFFDAMTAGQIVRVDARSGAQKIVARGLLSPGDMAFDDKGNLFVSEQGRSQIDEFKGMGVPVSNLSITAPAPLPPPPAPQVCSTLVNQPTAFNFCNEPIAGATPAQTFIVTNLSGSQVTGLTLATTPATTPSNFTILGTTCAPPLNAGASCNVQVEFTPQSSGEIDGLLTATDNQGDSSNSSVAGTGVDYQLGLGTGQGMQMNVYQGSSVTFNLQVMPDDTFADTVTFVCPPSPPGKTVVNGDMPPYTTCSFTPATAPVTPGTPVPFTVKFTTTLNYIPPPVTTPTTGMIGPFGTRPLTRAQRAVFFPALAIFAMASLISILRWPERRLARLRYALTAMALAGMVGGVGAMSACHKTLPNPAIQTTPTGTTTMNVTATTQGASRGVPITLQVIPIP